MTCVVSVYGGKRASDLSVIVAELHNARMIRAISAVGSSFITAWHSVVRLTSRIGIAWRLALAFATVAILAAAANFMAAEGELVLMRVQAPPAAPIMPEPVAAPVSVTPIASPLPVVPVATDTLARRTDDFRTALDRYDSAVQARAQIDAPASVAQLKSAEDNLVAAAKALTNLQNTSTTRRAVGTQAITRVNAQAMRLIELADHHRGSVAAYSLHLDSMKEQVKKSVDDAWKIFGRVVARQSLIQLSTDLDELRKHFSALQGVGLSNPEAFIALAGGEAALDKTLTGNASSLSRSQGKEWLSSMNEAQQALEQTRRTIAATDVEWREVQVQFSGSVTALRAAATTLAATAPKSVPAAAPAVSVKVPVVASPVAVTAIEPAPMGQRSAPSQPQSVTASPPSDRRMRMAWLTASVLALLIIICVSTVFSIVRPVKALLRAIANLGKEGTLSEVPRGGIKELDAVAAAFNQMARDLTASQLAAQEYQDQLEVRVEERTRQLKELAERDALTSLPNRRQLFSFLDETLKQAALSKGTVGVLFLDLDNFKNINDSMGHAFGDQVLVRVAERLDGLVKEVGVAARLGGDEFTVVLHRVREAEDVRRIGLVICRAFQEPLSVDERELIIGVSIGASVYPNDEQTTAGLMTAADAALFQAKALGRGQLATFKADLLAAAATKFQTEQSLRRAIERGEFELLFQPEINAERLEVTVVEALLRWRAPNGKLVSPAEFLSVAEESGLIADIGEWVLRAAIEAAAGWYHGAWPQAKVAINVSPRQLLDIRFVDKVRELLERFRLPGHCIEIELTEDVLQTGPTTLNTLRRLRALGIAIALDDFGTGYSSFSSLERLPLSRIKLDRSLTSGLDSNRRSAAITRAIIGMCHELGLAITAEGVESSAQFSRLVGYRDMNLQGFLLSKPVPAAELLGALATCAQYARLLSMSSSAEERVALG